MPYKKITPKTCEHCGVSFLARPDQRGRFCSRHCQTLAVCVQRGFQVGPTEERFWWYVDKNGPVLRPELGPCWLWTGSVNGSGYGRFHSPTGPIPAARYAYESAHGPLPVGCWPCHKCDNPPCVREDHLFAGTPADNVRDMMEKRRHWSQTGSYEPPKTGRGVSITCRQCGIEVRISPSRLGRRAFCSKACKAEWEHSRGGWPLSMTANERRGTA